MQQTEVWRVYSVRTHTHTHLHSTRVGHGADQNVSSWSTTELFELESEQTRVLVFFLPFLGHRPINKSLVSNLLIVLGGWDDHMATAC